VVVLFVPAALAAAALDSNAPSYALGSEWVHRLQVALAVFAGLYLFLLVFWLAYQGRTVQRADLPGGAGVEFSDPDLSSAADEFETYRRTTDARITVLEESIEVLKGEE
jgi:hypothetical protein